METTKNRLVCSEGNLYYKGGYISKGGNGKVFKVTADGSKASRKLVVKQLLPKLSVKRRKRFIREITVMKDLNGLEGIFPITAYNTKDKLPWYIMPDAVPVLNFIVQNNMDIKSILNFMLDLAYIIKRLHNSNQYHRDIKPSNLLIMDKKIYLADFGLTFNSDYDEHLTTGNEPIGPAAIRPPELEKNTLNIYDYSTCDIYLFAKTIWMLVKKDTWGFKGEYTRKEWYYLNKEYYNIQTFEPLHRLLEGATKDDYLSRINIDECINHLTEQIAVIDGTHKNIEELALCEASNEIKYKIPPEIQTYQKVEQINNILQKVIPYARINISSDFDNYLPKFISVKFNGELFEFFDGKNYFLAKISQIELSSDNSYKIKLDRIDNLLGDYKPISDYFNPWVLKADNKFIFNEELYLHISAST